MDSGTAEMYRLETLGIKLVETMIARAGLLGTVPLERRVIVTGPDFAYEASPTLFAGRVGRGPLRIALDTNLLIDYFDHGHTMWSGESLTELHPDEEYSEHLEALQLILAVWVLRDIELIMLKESLRDTKRGLLAPHLDQRNRNAWAEFYRALTHSPHHHNDMTTEPKLPSKLIDEVVKAVPAGGDRSLVRAALLDGAHVYLTRDKGVLHARSRLGALGLSVMSPADLLEALSMCGALNFLWDPASLYWPLPDQEKVAHMIWALPKSKN